MTLEERVKIACKDPSEMDDLIRDYTPFIKAAISKTLKKYIESSDSVLTIGMMGFHEAVTKYDPAKGGFLSYAQIVIRNRIIDEMRKENKQTTNIELMVDSQDDDHSVGKLQDNYAVAEFEKRRVEDQRKDDLVLYMEVLKAWDLTMSDLVQASPKKKELLKLYQDIGKYIAENEEMLEHTRVTRRLPASFILDNFSIDRKRLDRGRKYIIAVLELWAGDFETLKSYIEGR